MNSENHIILTKWYWLLLPCYLESKQSNGPWIIVIILTTGKMSHVSIRCNCSQGGIKRCPVEEENECVYCILGLYCWDWAGSVATLMSNGLVQSRLDDGTFQNLKRHKTQYQVVLITRPHDHRSQIDLNFDRILKILRSQIKVYFKTPCPIQRSLHCYL